MRRTFNTVSVGIHQEQAKAVLVTGLTRGTNQHDQLIRMIPIDDTRLGAIEHHIATLHLAFHGGVFQGKDALVFLCRKRQLQTTFQQGRNGFCLLRVRAVTQETAAQYYGGNVRRHDQAFAQFLQQHHGFQRAHAQTTVLFSERYSQPAQFGKLCPGGFIQRHQLLVLAVLFHVVVVTDKTLGAVRQHLLFFTQLKIHLTSPCWRTLTNPARLWQ